MVCAATHAVTQADLNARSYTNVAIGDSNETPADTDDETVPTVAPPPPPPPPPPPAPAPGTPGITIAKSPDQQSVASGGTVTFSIVVTNTGQVALTNVRVQDALAPECARTSAQLPGLAAMAPGASVTYTCTQANVTQSLTNVATVAATPPSGADVTATDSAQVTVAPLAPAPKPAVVKTNPAITIAKTPGSQTVPRGSPASWTIKVTNSGDARLNNVVVVDPKAPSCNRRLGTLAPGASRSYTCSKPNTTANYTNVARAAGKAPNGERVTDTASADVKTAALKPPKPKAKPKPKPLARFRCRVA